MMKIVKLLGELGRKFGREWRLNIHTPAEAIKAIAVNCPGFIEYLYASEERGLYWRVVIDEPQGIDQSQFGFPITQKLVIAPIITGSGGFGRILLGGALIAASVFMPASVSIIGIGITSTTVGLLGAALLFQGISSLLAPQNKTPKNNKNESYLFDRSAGSGRQGSPVPIGYGERLITDPVIISQGITTEEIPAN
jgi:predicted phage tail protein